jgi:DNA polymerase-3 subunit delta'
VPFRDVLGHARLIDLLARSVAGGTLPPSLVLAGPAGIGKRLTAVAVAQALNCLKSSEFLFAPSGFDACGTCAACTRIARGVHPDVLIVQPGESGAIKVDQVRDRSCRRRRMRC